MKKAIAGGIGLILVAAVLLFGAGRILDAQMPEYNDALGNDNYNEKLYGLELLKASAAKDDNIILYGSSELRTMEISTHPVNYFMNKAEGFQVNIVGRGSCQSIIHAFSIAAAGDSLENKKVVLITSPQSYVKEGIAPDLFLANFSKLHYLTIMADNALDDSFKLRFSERVAELLEEYQKEYGSYEGYEDILWYAKGYCEGGLLGVRKTLLMPYYGLQKYLLGLKDKYDSLELLKSVPALNADTPVHGTHEEETAKAIEAGKQMTDNNDYYMLNDYYNRNIGTKLKQQAGREKNLSYSESEEYDDLRLLLDLCKSKNIDVLFAHTPLNGKWSDYTGFTKDRRQEYYDNVSAVLAEYDNVTAADLTVGESKPYYLCDVMHLGWLGWLDFDEKLIEFYYDGVQ